MAANCDWHPLREPRPLNVDKMYDILMKCRYIDEICMKYRYIDDIFMKYQHILSKASFELSKAQRKNE